MEATAEGQDKVLATAQRIVQSLNTSDADDMLMILTAFDNRLSSLSSLVSGEEPSSGDPRLEAAEKIIMNEANSSSLSEEYFDAVDEIIQLTEELNLNNREGGTGVGKIGKDNVRDRAENALQLAMTRLEDEFRHILIRNTVPLDPDPLHRSTISPFAAAMAVAAKQLFNDDVSVNLDDVSSTGYSQRRRSQAVSFGGDDISLDLVNPEAVIDLKEIANRMIRSGYEKECCQVYCNVRRDVLDECLTILGVEVLSIEDVQKIEWSLLDDKMKKWIQAVKVVVRGLLSSEKGLCERIFSGSDLIKEVCFLEASKGCVVQLLSFGEAVSVGRRSSEKLFRVLDMYDTLAEVLPDLKTLFMDEEAGEMVVGEAKAVLDGLGYAAVGIFVEFENAVKGEASKKRIQNGDIHPLSRYVMNYVKLLVDYTDTLNTLLEKESELVESQIENSDNLVVENMSLVARRVLVLIESLESNLQVKSRMYEDEALKHIFLMNNILYIVQKVKNSPLWTLLGDNWIKRRRGLIRLYSTYYLRAAWSKVLSTLKDDGTGASSNNASKVVLKERFKNFNACFEDIYRIQTGWKITDPQLREELRIAISEKVIPAYRSFLGRYGNHLESGKHAGKYIKYTAEDLENYLLDLFEGTPLMLHNTKRKST